MVKNKAVIVCMGLVFILISGIIYILTTPSDQVVYQSDTVEADSKELIPNKQANINEAEEKVLVDVDNTSEILHNSIVVYICGSVNEEGVYTLSQGARVYEALELAGGLTKEAQSDYINLARTLEDGESIYFPSQEEVKDLGGKQWESGDKQTSTRINLNKASEAELTELPGIGSAKAKAIISYREKTKSFERIEDIMEVPGIKENTFEVIKELISV